MTQAAVQHFVMVTGSWGAFVASLAVFTVSLLARRNRRGRRR